MKKLKILPLCIFCIITSGCWDRIEIDRNYFISAIGIDVGKDIGKEKEIKKISPDEPFGEREMERINVTFLYPDISGYNAQKGSMPEAKFIKTKAYSMEDSVSNALTKSSRNINLGHTKVLAISEDLLKYPEVFKEIIDYLARQPQINRMTNLLVIQGSIEEFFKTKSNMEKNLQAYLSGLMESTGRNSTILPVNLNELLILLSDNGNAIIPSAKLDKEENEISITGVAILKNYALEGFLTPQETSDLEILRGKLKSGKKVIYKDGHPIDIEIDGIKRKLQATNKDNKLAFNISIEIEGKIKGYYLNKDILAMKELDSIESNFNKSLSEECEKVIKLTQKQFGVDPIGLREYIEKFHPSISDKVKDKWEEEYRDADIKVTIDTNIRRIGIKK